MSRAERRVMLDASSETKRKEVINANGKSRRSERVGDRIRDHKLKRFISFGTAALFLMTGATFASSGDSLMGALIGKEPASLLLFGDENSYAAEKGHDVASDTEEKVTNAFPALKSSSSGDSVTKDETVFVIMDADGEETERVIDETINNPTGEKTIDDYSTLSDIENVSGNEKFSKSGNTITWNASGNNIKYQGKSDKDLPVSVEVSYYLDGEEVTAEEIAGKSGDVEIHFDYNVEAKETIPARGGTYELTHPYVMASGVVLSDEHFSDVEVSNGKAVSEGDNTICLGIAIPGLQESLGIDKDTIDIPESVVIKATTDKFEIDGTYSVAMSGLLGEMTSGDGMVQDKVEEVEDGFDQLLSASDKLVSGSDKLAAGALKLSNGTSTLEVGTDSLRSGSKALYKGTGALYSGTKSLASGAGKLADGTSELKNKSSDLADGVDRLYDGAKQLTSGTSELKKGSTSAVSGAKSLNDGLAQISGSSSDLNNATQSVVDSVFQSATAQLQATLISGGVPEAAAKQYVLKEGTYVSILEQLSQAFPPYANAFVQVKASLDSVVQYKQAVSAYTAGVDSAAAGSGQLYSGLQSLDKGIGDLDKGAGKLERGLSELDSSIPALKKGVSSLNSGASALSKGANKVRKGAKSLSKGSKKLYNGAAQIEDGADALASGSKTLSKGTDTLANGMYKFDRDGINKLVNSFDTGKITDIANRFDAVQAASERKVFIGGVAADMEGESKIVYKTGEVKA